MEKTIARVVLSAIPLPFARTCATRHESTKTRKESERCV